MKMLLIRLFYERIHLVFIEKHFVCIQSPSRVIFEAPCRVTRGGKFSGTQNLQLEVEGIIYILFQVVLINHSS